MFAPVLSSDEGEQAAAWLEGLRRRTEVSDLYAVGK